MTQPSKTDIKKRQDKLDKLLRGLEEDGSMSEKKLCTQLRSAVRQVWAVHDVKVSYLMSKSYADMDMKTRTKWLVDCEMCGESFKCNDVAIDHIKGEHSLKTFEDLVHFATSILGVSHKDLKICCHPCHDAKTYAERWGMSLEEAFAEKDVIAKINQKVPVQKKELTEAGFKPKDISNNDKRRDCYRQLLKDRKCQGENVE